MANTSSAKKAQRAATRKGVFNARRKKNVKDAVKGMGKLILGKSMKEASEMLPKLQKAIDKAVKHGTVNKNTAARMKSNAAKALRSLKA